MLPCSYESSLPQSCFWAHQQLLLQLIQSLPVDSPGLIIAWISQGIFPKNAKSSHPSKKQICELSIFQFLEVLWIAAQHPFPLEFQCLFSQNSQLPLGMLHSKDWKKHYCQCHQELINWLSNSVQDCLDGECSGQFAFEFHNSQCLLTPQEHHLLD